ncbi:MAG: hypothetical protein HC925_09490, partial [Coleofasciculaceae cyanobacterium SM2_3_26]|nr:hypothetical protein [Coleofasciculaceae cyanobacterium SM2_3_26]
MRSNFLRQACQPIYRARLRSWVWAIALGLGICLPVGAAIDPLFEPHLEEIRRSLPPGVQLRLPASVNLRDENLESVLRVRVLATNSPPGLTISLLSCDTAPRPCLVGSFTVDRQQSANAQRELTKHQQRGQPIAFDTGKTVYLLRGPEQNPAYPFSSVMWQQDGTIYTVSFLDEERQSMLEMVYSMTNEPAIASTRTV